MISLSYEDESVTSSYTSGVGGYIDYITNHTKAKRYMIESVYLDLEKNNLLFSISVFLFFIKYTCRRARLMVGNLFNE